MAVRNLLAIILFCLLSFFSGSAQNYTVINDATVYGGCNCYRLTPASNNKGGGVYQNNTINLNNSFDYTFSVFLGCNTNGADGIVFILTNNVSGIGAQGGGLGYQGLSGNSFAAEFDTYQNSQDPSYNHIAFESGGSVNHNVAGPVPALPSSANIDDCVWHTARIVWDVNTHTYSVYMDGSLRLSYTGNIVNTFFGGNPIVNWGWSGSTGGGNNDQRFCINSISNWVAGTNYQSCLDSIAFHDISTSNVASVQSWAWKFGDPASGLRDTSAMQNPSHIYPGAGNYTVRLIITDISGCPDTFSHVVNIGAPISSVPTLSAPPCNGGNNGSISVATTGGFGASAGYYSGYQYTWSNNFSGVNFTNNVGLTAGTYNLIVTDGVCTTTSSYTLNQPPALTATTSHTDAPCASTGTATVTLSGGTPPYTGVTWDGIAATPGPNTFTTTGLPSGIVVADFHDANGCSALLTYKETINSLPCGYTLSTSSTNVTCFGGTNGTASLTVTGSIGTVTITWTNSSNVTVGSGASISGLAAGAYTYHYSDGRPQTFTGTVTINQPGGAVTASITTQNTSCSYLNDGTAVASITANGTSPYTYVWSAAGQGNSPSASGLSPGAISVNITDNNGCTATASGSVSGQTPLSLTMSNTPDSCYQTNTGTTSVSVTGGTPGYTYVWSSSAVAIGSSDYDLAAANYIVTVTDHNGCTATGNTTVTQPPVVTATMASVNELCNGAATGSVTITPAGGNGGFTYVWSGSANTTATLSGVAAGTYYVTATDSKLCSIVDSATVTQPTKVRASVSVLDSVTCNGGNNGGVTVIASGGTPSYSYALDAGAPQASGTFSGLTPGAHTVTVKDVNACDSIVSFTIYQPTALVASIIYTRAATCNGTCNGSIRAGASGGVGPYTYSKDGVTFSSVDSFTALCAGPYTITIKDTHGCTATSTTSVTQPTPVVATLVSVTQPSCFGSNNGQIVISASGGAGSPYQYDIDFNPITQATGNFTGLAAGLHIVSASDANHCLDTLHILLTQTTALTVSTISSQQVSCFGGSDGTITLGVSGGTYPYSYSWPQAAAITDSLGVNLTAGSYTTYVTDAHSCRDTVTNLVTQPTKLRATITVLDSISCNGLSDGGITVVASGGTGPSYTYALDAGAPQSGGTFSGLTAGAHTVTVKDTKNCDSIVSFNIYQPTPVVAGIIYTKAATCNGTCNGSIRANASGGVGPYTYSKDGITFSPTDSFTALCAGPFTITVKDAHGCTGTVNTAVTQPTPLVVTLVSVTQPSCFGGNNGQIVINASGGVAPPYLYDIDFNPITQPTGVFTGLSAGLHIVGAGDANQCIDTLHIVLAQPAVLTVTTLSTRQVSCAGGNDGKITLGVSGGTYPFSYIWPQAPTITDSLGINLTAGTYSTYVSDAKGCKDTITNTLTQPTPVIPAIVLLDSISCFGANDGGVVLSATGGNNTYTYALDGGTAQSSNVFSGLTPGAHSVLVQDGNGCDSTIRFNTYEPIQVSVSVTSTLNDSCFGQCNGQLIVAGTGGTKPYQYSIDGVNYSSSDTFSGLCANPSYTLHIRDNHSCSNNLNASITQPALLVLSPVDSISPTCNNGSNGGFDVIASGGTPGYTYSADGGAYQASGSFSSQSVGSHTVTAKDANGCSASYTIKVINPPASSSYVSVDTNVSCHGGNNGSVTINVTGSTTPYTYAWAGNPSTNSSLTGLIAGTYIVTVKDGNGCVVYSADSSNTITEPAAISATQIVIPVTCYGDSTGCITVTPAGGTGPYTHSWTNGATTANPCGFKLGSYSDTIKDANGCQYIDANIQVTQPSQIAIFDSVVKVACIGQSNGAIYLTDTGGTPGYTYVWSNSAVSNPLLGIPVGSYMVTVTDANHCIVTDSIYVDVNSPLVINATKNNVLCPPLHNGRVTLSVTGGAPGYIYTWSNGSSSSSLANLNVGIDSVTITDSRGCMVDTSFTITNDSAFIIKAIPDTATINEGEILNNAAIQVTSSNNGAYGGLPATIVWDPAIGLSCSDCQAPLVMPVTNTNYTIHVVSDSGCVSDSRMLITVNPQHQLYVPNTFTPNNDGVNDYWEVFGSKKAWVFCEAEVFDRWGEKIYQTNDINFQWDGTYIGSRVEPGVYTYVFKVVFLDGYSVTNKGTITIIR